MDNQRVKPSPFNIYADIFYLFYAFYNMQNLIYKLYTIQLKIIPIILIKHKIY